MTGGFKYSAVDYIRRLRPNIDAFDYPAPSIFQYDKLLYTSENLGLFLGRCLTFFLGL